MLCVPRRLNARAQAFTLIEVVIALGVAVFSLVAILGLFSAGLNADSSASRSTTIANMALQVTNDLRGHTNWTLGTGANTYFMTHYYFDNEGNPLPGSQSGTAYYDCKMTLANTNQPPVGALSNTSFLAVKMAFSWPASAQLAHPLTTNVYSSVRP